MGFFCLFVFFMADRSCFFFILFLYFEDSPIAECAAGKKSHSWLRKNQSRDYKREKNYRAFKLIPKAPIGVCIVLFFITFQ